MTREALQQTRAAVGQQSAGGIQQFAIGDRGRAYRFAGPASHAIREMFEQGAFGLELAAGQPLYQRDAPSRGFPFEPGQLVCRAMRQAEATFDAAIGQSHRKSAVGVLVTGRCRCGGVAGADHRNAALRKRF